MARARPVFKQREPPHQAADNNEMSSRSLFRLTPSPAALMAFMTCALFAASAPNPARATDLAAYLPPVGATYVTEEVRLRVPAGLSLAGTLSLPTRGVLREGRPLRYPAILLVNAATGLTRDGSTIEDAAGSPVLHRPMFELADALARRDVAVLRLDARGVGASTGANDSTSLSGGLEDVRAELEYLRRRADIDPHRIAILGMGEGASIAALIAGADADLRAVLLLAAPTSLAKPNSPSVLALPGDSHAVVSPAGAESWVRPVLAKVADWSATTLGGAELGPKPLARVVHRRRRR